MNGESTLLIEIWNAVRDHVPANRRADIAVAIVNAFADYGLDASDFRDTLGEDELITDALAEAFGTDDEDEDEDVEDDDE